MYLYPLPDLRLSRLHDISPTLVAAEQYKMQHACHSLRAALSAKKDDAMEDPVLLYATASRFCMNGLTLTAARCSFCTDIMKSPVSELDSIGVSGGCLYRLFVYHKCCRLAVESLLAHSPCDWKDLEISVDLQDACPNNYNSALSRPCWYGPYMARLSREHWPSSEFVMREDLLESVLDSIWDSSGFGCPYCVTPRGALLFVRFSKTVAEAIRAIENNVRDL